MAKYRECACGKVFRVFGRRRYCSRACSSAAERRRLDMRGRSQHHRWRDLAERQGWLCPWCGDCLPDEHRSVEVDHIVPASAGGGIGWDNIQAMHKGCNQEKGTRSMEEAPWDGWRTLPPHCEALVKGKGSDG